MSELAKSDNFPGLWASKPLFWMMSLCCLHLFIWTLVPALLQKNGALDVLEAIAWGSQWQLGYDRDPFLVAWLAKLVSTVGGSSLWSIYLLSQLCVITSFWAVWRLGRSMGLGLAHTFMAVIFLEGIFYYHLTTPEFNDNVLQIPLWSMTIAFFYDALKTQRLKYWIITGLMLGLAMLAKYFTVMLIVPMAGIVLLTETGRQSLRKPGIYAGAVISLLIFSPNVYWQIQNDWQYIHYALDRSKVPPSWLNHISYPLKFALSQILALSPALVLFLWGVKARFKAPLKTDFRTIFLLVMALGPFLTTFMYSLITGTQIRSMWGTPLFSMLGLLLVYLCQPTQDDSTYRRYAFGYLSYFTVALVAYIVMVTASPYLLGYAKNEFYPSQAMARDVTQLWRQQYQRPLPYVIGARRLAARVQVYSQDHPTPYFDVNPKINPWIRDGDVHQQGGVILWDVSRWGETMPEALRQQYPAAKSKIIRHYSWQTNASGIAPVVIGIALLPPRSVNRLHQGAG